MMIVTMWIEATEAGCLQVEYVYVHVGLCGLGSLAEEPVFIHVEWCYLVVV